MRKQARIYLLITLMLGSMTSIQAEQEVGESSRTEETDTEQEASAQPGVSPSAIRTFRWTSGRQLLLRIPDAWEAERHAGSDGTLSIEMKPRSGRLFSYVIDAIPLTLDEQSRLQGDELRRITLHQGERMLPHSRENTVRLERVLGDGGQGYVYSLTEARRNLPSGEYRYLTAGTFVVEDLLLAPSLVHDDTSGAIRLQALDILRSVRVVFLP